MRNFYGYTRRALILAALAVFLAATAHAYTLVMRDGRRVKIPDNFTVTETSLTYEVAPGLSVTALLANVNIAATERANGEAAGSLLARAKVLTTQSVTAPPRAVTNADLAKFRAAREAAEQAANQRRAAAGQPPLAEERRRLAEERNRQADEIAKITAEQQREEARWRERAANLRAEAAALDAEIDYLSARLEARPRRNRFAFRSYGYAPLVGYVAPSVLPPGQVVGPPVNPFPQPLFGYGYYRRPFVVAGGGYASSNRREDLQTRLDELLARRAALEARWNALQEEARRANVPPGWLR
jgi:hypothetical protein